MHLTPLFQPRAVAIIGASTHPEKLGSVALRVLKDCGYSGAIFPINSTAREVHGLPAWPRVSDLPEVPDVAIVAVPADRVEAALEDCIQAGVQALVVFSSGFGEAGAEGLAQQERLAQRARTAGVTLLGPNCLGVMNLRTRWIGTFSPAPLAGLPEVGNVAIVSQSGAFGIYAFALARKAGLGLSHWVTTGNQAAVTVANAIEWLADDADTRVIVAYIEGTDDGQQLRRALLRARRAGKPVIVTKVGRTAAGAAAAMSHTASLSGDDAIYQALIEETGAIRAWSIDEMFRLAQAFSTMPVPRGKRLGILTVSGGVGTMMADSASDAGLELPPMPQDIADALRARVAFCSTTNPIDITGQFTADYDAVFNDTVFALVQREAYDAVVFFLAAAAAAPSLGPKMMDSFRRTRQLAPALPLAITGIVAPSQVAELHALGYTLYEEPSHAIETIAAMLRWHSARIDDEQNDAAALAPLALSSGSYDEAQGLALLQDAGVPAAPHRVAHSADEAVAAWRELGSAPVVLKIVSRDLLHKSDVGGVRVGPRTEAEVREAYAAIEEAVARLAPQARREGMLVARKLQPQLELILGARHDKNFGPVVVLGRGGVDVELDAHTALMLAPCNPQRVHEQLARLGILQRMSGHRGQAVIDPAPLIELVLRFSALAARIGPALRSMEVNPLMVTPEGVYAADAVVQID